MGLEVLETSAAPVQIEALLTHLRIDPIDTDAATHAELDMLDHLQQLLDAATEHVQGETRQQLTDARFRLTVDAFPIGREFRLPKPPLRSVESVKYIDVAGQVQTLDTSAYLVDTTQKPGRVIIRPGHSWPQADTIANAVRVEFTAGYEDTNDVPQALRLAIKMLAGHWFENREAATDRRVDAVPMALDAILAQHSYPELVG